MLDQRRTAKAVEILSEAQFILATNGWTTSYMHRMDEDGKHYYCAIGAVNAAACGIARLTPRTPAVMTAIRALAREVRQRGGLSRGQDFNIMDTISTRHQVISYNDHAANRSSIISLFGDAIDQLRADMQPPAFVESTVSHPDRELVDVG